MNNKKNIVKYIKIFSVMLFVLVVAMVINTISIATTNPTAPAVDKQQDFLIEVMQIENQLNKDMIQEESMHIEQGII